MEGGSGNSPHEPPEGSSQYGGGEGDPISPQYSLEQMSLQAAMDQNKESLQRKLQYRRSVNELVDQGIYPSQPTAFAEQTRLLQRARTQDRLKSKIQNRPDRQQLVQQHILEDSNADPSLQRRQLLLKKAQLTDELNDKLAHRPGPLELVAGNILQVQEPINLDGVTYVKTEDGTDTTVRKLPYEVQSPPKSGHASPDPLEDQGVYNSACLVSSVAGAQPGITSVLHQAEVPFSSDVAPLLQHSQQSAPPGVGVSPPVGSLPSGGARPQPTTTASASFPPPLTPTLVSPTGSTCSTSTALRSIPKYTHQQSSSSGTSCGSTNGPGAPTSGGGSGTGGGSSAAASGGLSSRINKKSKLKTVNKPKMIKFHEYKGPPTSKGGGGSKGGESILGAGGLTTAAAVMAASGAIPGAIPVPLGSLGEGSIVRGQGLGAKEGDNTRYSIMLQQQQLFLQMQLEFHKKSLPVLVPVQQVTSTPAPAVQQQQVSRPASALAAPSPAPSVDLQSGPSSLQSPASQGQVPPPPPPPPQSHHKSHQSKNLQQKPHAKVEGSKSLGSLQDMKVAELKALLKQRNLPVSGSKPQLIERLKGHLGSNLDFNVPSVKSVTSDSSFTYSNVSSVQSSVALEESMSGPASVMSTAPGSAQSLGSSAFTSLTVDTSAGPLSISSSHHSQSSCAPMDVDDTSQQLFGPGASPPVSNPLSPEAIVLHQAKQIENLRKQLHESERKLQLQQIASTSTEGGTQSQRSLSQSQRASGSLLPGQQQTNRQQPPERHRPLQVVATLQQHMTEEQQQQLLIGQQRRMSLADQQLAAERAQQKHQPAAGGSQSAQPLFNGTSHSTGSENGQFVQPLPPVPNSRLTRVSATNGDQVLLTAAAAAGLPTGVTLQQDQHPASQQQLNQQQLNPSNSFSLSSSANETDLALSTVVSSSSGSEASQPMYFQTAEGQVIKLFQTIAPSSEAAAAQKLNEKAVSLPTSPKAKEKPQVFTFPSMHSEPFVGHGLGSSEGKSKAGTKDPLNINRERHTPAGMGLNAAGGTGGEGTGTGGPAPTPQASGTDLVQSQCVADVLNILIQAGELPESAAKEPLSSSKSGQAHSSGLHQSNQQSRLSRAQPPSKLAHGATPSLTNGNPVDTSPGGPFMQNMGSMQPPTTTATTTMGIPKGRHKVVPPASLSTQGLMNGGGVGQSASDDVPSPFHLSPEDMMVPSPMAAAVGLGSPLALDELAQPFSPFGGMDWSDQPAPLDLDMPDLSSSPSAAMSTQAAMLSEGMELVDQSGGGADRQYNTWGGTSLGAAMDHGMDGSAVTNCLDWLDIEQPASVGGGGGSGLPSVSFGQQTAANCEGRGTAGFGGASSSGPSHGEGGGDFHNDPILTPKVPQDPFEIFNMSDYNIPHEPTFSWEELR